MNNIFTIFKKELTSYIKSPMAYIVAASFYTVTGFFFIASVSDAFSEALIGYSIEFYMMSRNTSKCVDRGF